MHLINENDFRVGFHSFSPFRPSTFGSLFDSIITSEDFAYTHGLDLRELDNDDYQLSVTLPGFKQSDVSVEIEDDTLTIEAVKGDDVRYSRSLTLPKGVDPDKVTAKLEHGILVVTLGRLETAKPRKIAVT